MSLSHDKNKIRSNVSTERLGRAVKANTFNENCFEDPRFVGSNPTDAPIFVSKLRKHDLKKLTSSGN